MGCTTSKNDASQPGINDLAESNLPHVFKDRYKLGETLGEGAFSKVQAAYSKSGGPKRACKIVERDNLPLDDEDSLRSEVAILSSMNHPNIVKCFDFFEESKQFMVILEYLEGGELFDRIVKKSYYNEREARDLIKILLSAIRYCHDRNVVHRDLKPENLLMMSKEDDADLKIADFGFAVNCVGSNLTTQCGTPGYVAPEILNHVPYGKSVDMWSIGVICYIILGGYPPFYDDNVKNLYKKIKACDYEFHPDYWKAVSDEAKDLISKMLTLDPKKRITADEALRHPWLKVPNTALEARNLDSNLAELRKFNASRKFKGK